MIYEKNSNNPKVALSVIAREWFDKMNGNSYFSARIYCNGKAIIALPFQYGYGSHFKHEAIRAIIECGRFESKGGTNIIDLFPREIFEECEMIEKGLMRDVIAWGKL